METTVVNVRDRTKGPMVYIGRGSIWGNPYRISRTISREEVITDYETYVRGNAMLMANLPTLRGKRLGCYCKPFACHGDVLVKLIRELDEKESANEI